MVAARPASKTRKLGQSADMHIDSALAYALFITVSRSFKQEGASNTFFYRDITDSENNATIHTGKELKTKNQLGSRRPESYEHEYAIGAVTLETYTPAADGTMLVSVLRPEHKPISLLFQRK
jgi:hypothetical protein